MAVLFACLTLIVYFASLMCSHASAFRIAANMKKALLEKLVHLPSGYIQLKGSGQLRAVITQSTQATENYLAHMLPDSVGAVTTPVCLAAMLFLFNWKFGIACLIPFAVAFFFMFQMAGPSMAEDMRQYNDALSEMNGAAVEYVRGIPVVKMFGQTVHSFTKFKDAINNYFKYCIRYCYTCRPYMLMFTLFINSAFVFLIGAALLLSRGKPLSSELLQSFIFYVIFTPALSTSITKVMYLSENDLIVSDALSRIHEVLDQAEIERPEASLHAQGSDIELENVRFFYPGSNRPALDGLSLEAAPGKITALCGPSGGGKSTAASLMAGLWDPSGGTVRIGGRDIKSLSEDELSEAVTCVFQDSRLLKTSILENVRLAKPGASRKEVMEALSKAQCLDLVEKLPDGVDTVIGSEGVYLSGGEQQRIAIARAVLKDTPIILLDEATAFADPENEVLVQEAFRELSKNKTVLFIAHRLSTIQDADRIYVIEDGKVKESGAHADLLGMNGLYARMWENYGRAVDWKV